MRHLVPSVIGKSAALLAIAISALLLSFSDARAQETDAQFLEKQKSTASATSAEGAEHEQLFTREQLDFFERNVRPLLIEHCYSCHSEQAQQLRGGLYLDSRQDAIDGGDSGSSIIPGHAEQSLLISAVRYDEYEMPPSGKLPESKIETLAAWIDMGAPWPAEETVTPEKKAHQRKHFDVTQRADQHWVWQPLTQPDIPGSASSSWAITDIDRFIAAKLDEQGLSPAKSADRYALLRRIYLDLIGLPPTVDQIERFENDQSDHAFESVVDELLRSPHFGERWGRHWLDLVRYAESRGHEFDNDSPNAFQYRDYVIRALNSDVPYDQFIREHIAGDLLDTPRVNPEKGFNESILGTGFWFLGEWVHSPVDILKDESDRFDNMIDVMSKTFQGITVSCARCHDHKFDAISTADYYSLSGFLQSSDYRQVRFESQIHNAEIAKELTAIDRSFQQKIRSRLRERGLSLPKPAARLDNAAVIVDFDNFADTEFIQDGFIFGSEPRGAGTIFQTPDGSFKIAEHSSAANDPFWKGLKSITSGAVQNQNRLAKIPRSGRMLRTPTFDLSSGWVDCLVEGQGHIIACVDSHRQIHGPLHNETIVKVQGNQTWTRLNLNRYVGHRVHLEFVPDDDKYLSVRLVAQGLLDEGKAEIESALAKKYQGFRAYAEAGNQILALWNQPDQKTAENRELISLLSHWQQTRETLRQRVMLESHLAPAMLDGTGENAHIYIRGDSSKPGASVPRHYLSALCGETPMGIHRGSGRLQLANAIAAPNNPLTSRVMVNRIWHYLMGRGIVASTDDFGVLGTPPTHPELLDYLAQRFIKDNYSIKKLIRYIVLSNTYRMSSVPDNESIRVDPSNRLWHYRPPTRIDGEVIRDSLLVLSGKFDSTQFGPSVPTHLTPFMEGRGRPRLSGPPDGNGRRSIYLAVRRNFLSPFFAAFDTPAPFSTMGRRTKSNVPAQALILMNDPFVFEQSKEWATLTYDRLPSDGQRIDWLYKSAFARPPTDKEKQVAQRFLGEPANLDRWISLAHALVNTKEFTFAR